MTAGTTRSPGAGTTATDPPAGDLPSLLLATATAWIGAEAFSVAHPGRVDLAGIASERAVAYEGVLAIATLEDIRLAWEQAVVRQGRHEMGSAPWRGALRIAELLRFELEAAGGATAG